MKIEIAVQLALFAVASAVAAQTEPETISPAVEQLRHAAGLWDATTEFLDTDGSVAHSVEGTYEFDWVVPDRVLVGRSGQGDPSRAAAILFYYQESENMIGMASVGADGHLWVMTGSADEEVRSTPATPMADGSTVQLRFTRYNVGPDSFESKMEYSTDRGESWAQGNHQLFRRRPAAAASPEPASPS